ncbi:Protein GLUTAMINE DUMPER 3 [Linum perenne]
MASGRQFINTTPRPAASDSFSPGMERSPWHSPVPYLFGGLAAMLGLIAFALLILACSYWKLSGYIDGAERDLESGEGGDEKDGQKKKAAVEEEYEEKVLVIMAGQLKPTFLATPISSRSESFAGSEKTCSCNDKLEEPGKQGSENRGSAEQSENRGMEEQSENRGSEEQSENRGVAEQSENRGSEEQSENRGTAEQSENRGGEEQS